MAEQEQEHAEEAPTDEAPHKHTLRERLHEHLEAAEVAAEEAAGYGWATEAVEAAEAAVDPKHELGDPKADDSGSDKESSSDR